jgi:hypothetical protein
MQVRLITRMFSRPRSFTSPVSSPQAAPAGARPARRAPPELAPVPAAVRARHASTVLVITELAVAASIVASLAALIWHSTDPAALAGLAATLMCAVFRVTRLPARRGRGRPRGTDTMTGSPAPPAGPERKPSP